MTVLSNCAWALSFFIANVDAILCASVGCYFRSMFNVVGRLPFVLYCTDEIIVYLLQKCTC